MVNLKKEIYRQGLQLQTSLLRRNNLSSPLFNYLYITGHFFEFGQTRYAIDLSIQRQIKGEIIV